MSMDSLRLLPFFPCFLWLPVALALVEPPTNVTLRCQNLHNILEWTYGQLVPGLRFRVNIQPYYGTAKVMWSDPPDLQVDLSAFSDPDDYYYLTVTAVIGQNESESAPADGFTYSYYMDAATNQICHLDLPAVNVTALPDDILRFSFLHPWLFYQDSLPRKNKMRRQSENKHHLPDFKYRVRLVSQKHPHDRHCVERVCEDQIPVDAAEPKHCVNISGEMMKMEVRATQLFCALPFSPPPSGHNSQILYVLIPLVVLFLCSFVLFLIYKKKTRPNTKVPDAMKINKTNSEAPSLEEGTRPDFVTHMEPSSPTPLLSHEQTTDFTAPVRPDTHCNEFIPFGRNREAVQGDGEAEPDASVNDDGDRDDDGDEGQGYRGGSGLEEDEGENTSEGHSGYERRNCLVDLDQNDLDQNDLDQNDLVDGCNA